MALLLKKLRLANREFVTAEELETHCATMRLNYGTVVRYFATRGYLVRVFRGIFYVRSLEELKLGRQRYNYLQLVAKGLAVKGVANWYFGLHTALKLNNLTHEHFAVDAVVSDVLFRAKPVRIAGYQFRFVKLAPRLLHFGIRKEEGGIRYSDSEKTVLDFIYLGRQNGQPESKITGDVSAWNGGLSKKRLTSYAAKYPKTVAAIAARVVG